MVCSFVAHLPQQVQLLRMCSLNCFRSLSLLVCANAVIIPIKHYEGPKILDNDITFHLYHRGDLRRSRQIFLNNVASLNSSGFDRRLPSKFIIHGWTHGRDIPWIVELREIMASSGLWNVIVVDWFPMAHAYYAESKSFTKLVGVFLGKFCVFLNGHSKVPVSSIHVIGHSLGGHIAGYAGLYVRKTMGELLGRITGLDPAAPFFEWPYKDTLDERLDYTDASFVDIIHTNGGNLGILYPTGHVDFYPNGGKQQPGCKFWLCSHMRSCDFFIESVKNPDVFKAYRYGSWEEYLSRHLLEKDKEFYPMGLATNAQMPRGIYFVETYLRMGNIKEIGLTDRVAKSPPE